MGMTCLLDRELRTTSILVGSKALEHSLADMPTYQSERPYLNYDIHASLSLPPVFNQSYSLIPFARITRSIATILRPSLQHTTDTSNLAIIAARGRRSDGAVTRIVDSIASGAECGVECQLHTWADDCLVERELHKFLG